MTQETLPQKNAKELAPGTWRSALLACLTNWPEQKEQFKALWKAPPEYVMAQSEPDWLKQMQNHLEADEVDTLQAQLQPVPHTLKISWPADLEPGEVLLDGSPVSLTRQDFEYLYALAHLQSQQTEFALLSPKSLYQIVLALFPQVDKEEDGEVVTLRQAFEQTVEAVLKNMESTMGQASGQRWRHLLMSQARRYATGLDDGKSYELVSELKQHRDLLDLMIQRFEQQAGLSPLETPAARLYRFFVSDPEALEIRHRLGGYVAKHMVRVRKALQLVQQENKQAGCPEEVLWGKPENRLWQEATSQGYALNQAVAIEIEAPPVLPVLIEEEIEAAPVAP
ncbi:MAG: hypothetical protein ACAI44_12385 [Candidatus Sericytochromatia bacterium]